MIEFKISRGLKANLPSQQTDGQGYLCIDTGELFFDIGNKRLQINADKSYKIVNAAGTTEYTAEDIKSLNDTVQTLGKGLLSSLNDDSSLSVANSNVVLPFSSATWLVSAGTSNYITTFDLYWEDAGLSLKSALFDQNSITMDGMNSIPFITWDTDQDTFSKIVSIDTEIKENGTVSYNVVATEEIAEDLTIRCFWAGAPWKAYSSMIQGG